MKFHVLTFGCQMNVYDSDRVVRALSAAGHQLTAELDEAELVLINTCSIRASAEARVWGTLGRLKHTHGLAEGRLLGVIGCMAQAWGARLPERAPYVRVVAGPHALGQLPRMVELAAAGEAPQVEVHPPDETEVWSPPVAEPAGPLKYPAFIAVMQGCNRRCTFCVVPQVRGPESCRSPEDVVAEAVALAAAGCREVTLIGQTVNSYRYGTVDLARLLELVAEVEGINWIRFATSHPAHMTERLVATVAAQPKLCAHFHLPVQSGADRILRRMGRGYNWADYRRVVSWMEAELGPRESGPVERWALTTDLLVGFPGETDEDFQATVAAMQEIRWDGAFMFKYSPREGTAAVRLPDPVPEEVKDERLARIIELQTAIGAEINARAVGEVVPVLVEEGGPEGRWRGRTRSNKPVLIQELDGGPAPAVQVGDIVEVRINGVRHYSLDGAFM